MEFITAEQFLKEDKEVQKVFIDWWRPSKGDLVAYEHMIIGTGKIRKVMQFDCLLFNSNVKYAEKVGKYIPLLTEGQLRQFIEDKLKSVIFLDFSYEANEGYFITFIKNSIEIPITDMYLGKDLLQAYWKVAVQIAREEVLNEKNNKNNK